ncbi:uncharacterized protein ATNIH1004_010337 [Aspergillus tanneri]|uniref:Uncharacterized protein n=1 Tax=Aspergillus tanneri TaxID=1220188 RepID=A0A5M9M9K5_9EURO|nr:uncharacterized protein ATNIH1004_010337 [Aspergillus tanneri]KAA8643568.1 hypothetical protein ATNIH1004_010337 [Aspergillus tanneri]
MPPAASDDLFRQKIQGVSDTSPVPEGLNRTNPENELGGKSKKKGKNGSKGKTKTAQSAKLPPEDLIPLPAEPSSCPDPPLEPQAANNNIGLDALDAFGESPDNDIAYRTDSWAKAIPFGKSPPTDVIDGELASGSPAGFLTHPDRGGFSNPSSASPGTRPPSYGTGYNSSRQPSADRRKSHSVSGPFSHQIPLPHLPQAHFYGAPGIDLPFFSGQNRSSTEDCYSFCAFDTISTPSSKMPRMGGNVLLVGGDGTLEILAIEARKIRLVGKLSGLSGRVIEAKILPCSSLNDPFSSSRPHVAVIIHGPSGSSDEESHTPSNGSETNEAQSVSVGRQLPAEKRPSKEDARLYQTRVEVYSLRSGDHITALFATQPTPCFENIPGLPVFAPSPVGNLKLFASGNHVVLASGVSGEVYIYSMSGYRCLGKTWTSIQSKEARRYSTSSGSTDPDGSRNDSPHVAANNDHPIIALEGRWLATVPPSSTYRASLRGTVPASLIRGKVFGLETRSPTSKPAATSATDAGEGESFLDKVARGVTQELVRGARWMGDQGLQAWNNYWNKEQSQSPALRRSPHMVDFPQHGYNAFPPTHAQDTQSGTATEPDLVSVLDLKKLEDSGEIKNTSHNPVAAFQVPNGCSFLSFSPNGLMLFTASKKGDVQYVWDLMQGKYCRAGAFLSDDSTTPCANVRQIARYARLTTSHIVDVIWCPPTGDRLAIITRNGTVHVFDLPRSAFQWPPFRRARPPPSKSPANDLPADEISDRTSTANPLSAAFKLVGGKTQPILAAVRGRTPSASAAFPAVGGFGLSSSAGVMSGKAVAAGLSKSVGAATGTVITLRHAGENRLHLSGLARDPAASRVTWITSKGQAFLGLVNSGFFRLYRVRRSVSANKNRQYQSVIGGKENEIRLPANMQTVCGAMPVGAPNPEPTIHASLALPSLTSRPSPASKLKCQPLSQAEIETNAPYQPFHTDQRVNLFIYSETGNETGDADDSLTSVPTGPWVFGDSMPMSKLHVRPYSGGGNDDGNHDDVMYETQPGFGGEMENLISLGNSTGHVEEVVITTRRKKKHSCPFPSTGTGGDDGFFEDDCEVLDFARDRV